jgi:SOS response regulatory protein OraA/RecX
MTDRAEILKVELLGDAAKVTLERTDQPLLVPIELVHRGNLVSGVKLTTAQIEKLVAADELYRCEQTALRLVAMREHSSGELRTKLRKRKFEKSSINAIVAKMIELGAVDDERYALLIGRSLVERRPCSRTYLSSYLQRRRVPRHLADRAATILLEDHDETALAEAALQQRDRRFRQLELEAAKRKAYNYLARRGFSFAAARVAFERWQSRRNEE